MNKGLHIGRGCDANQFGVPPHNPTPTTERGKRRLAKLNDGERKQREAAWAKARSNRPSRYQKVLESTGGRNA